MSPHFAVTPRDATDSMLERAGRLAAIVALHAGFFVWLQGGLAKAPAPAPAPKTVFVTFLEREPPPVAQAPRPVEPPPEPKPVEPPPKPKPEPKPKPKPEPKPQPKPKPKPAEKQITQEVKPEPPPEPVVADAAPAPAPPPPPVAAAPAVAPRPTAPPAPPAPPVPQEPKRITSGVAYVYNPAPTYPALSRRLGEEGTAVFLVLINERGLPEKVELKESSGSPRLDDAARRAVLSYRFKPYMENGRPVPSLADVPINFQLN